MYNESTQIKDFTEMERLMIGSSMNFIFNLLSGQIDHIEHHDESLLKILVNNEKAQEEFILLKNMRDISGVMTKVFGNTFRNISDEEKAILSIPALKLEVFFESVYTAILCGGHDN